MPSLCFFNNPTPTVQGQMNAYNYMSSCDHHRIITVFLDFLVLVSKHYQDMVYVYTVYWQCVSPAGIGFVSLTVLSQKGCLLLSPDSAWLVIIGRKFT